MLLPDTANFRLLVKVNARVRVITIEFINQSVPGCETDCSLSLSNACCYEDNKRRLFVHSVRRPEHRATSRIIDFLCGHLCLWYDDKRPGINAYWILYCFIYSVHLFCFTSSEVWWRHINCCIPLNFDSLCRFLRMCEKSHFFIHVLNHSHRLSDLVHLTTTKLLRGSDEYEMFATSFCLALAYDGWWSTLDLPTNTIQLL